MSKRKAPRWWLASAALLAVAGCSGGDDRAGAPASTSAALSTTAPPATSAAPTITKAPTTLAPPTIASTATTVAPTVTPGAVTSAPPAIPSTVTQVTPTVARHPWPTTISGRKVLDQFGDTYLMKVFSSWGMAQNLTNSEITDALEALAARGFNGVNVAPNGVGIQDDWVKYENVAGQDFFTGTPFASSLGPAWATMDHIVSEAQRLGMTVLLSFFVSYDTSGIGPDLTAASDTNAYDYGVAVASRYLNAPNIVWHVEADTGWQPEDAIGRRLDNIFRGIADTETTPRLIVAEPYLGGTGYQMFLAEEGTGTSAYEWLHLSTNAVYNYGNNAVDQFDAVWNETGATAYPGVGLRAALRLCDPLHRRLSAAAARAQLRDVHPRRLRHQLRRRGLVALRQTRPLRRRARVVRGAGLGNDCRRRARVDPDRRPRHRPDVDDGCRDLRHERARHR